MDIIKVIIQAVVQGLTEFLPVSSSGHLSLVQHLTRTGGEEGVFLMVVLHMGTLLAVFIAFWDTIKELIIEFFRMVGDIFTGKFKWKTMNGYRRMIIMIIISTAMLISVYFIKDFFTSKQSDGDIIFEGVAFLFTALLLFIADKCKKGDKKPEDITVPDAVTVGVAQCVALFPGVSRSGTTMTAGLLCGFSKKLAITYSFIMGIPAILGGGLLELKDAVEKKAEINWLHMGIGFIVSAVVGFFAIKMVAWLLKKDRFKIFAIYLLIIGLLAIGAGIYENITDSYIMLNI